MKDVHRISHSRHAETEGAQHLARALGWHFVDLEGYSISCGILRRIPAELACRLRCVPMVFNNEHAVVAVDDVFNALYIAANRQLLGPPYGRRKLQFALATRAGIDACLLRRVSLVRG